MHTFDHTKYPNLLNTISLSSSEIVSNISAYKLEFLSERNPEVEWRMKLPMFVNAFYDYIISNQRIPNQNESLDYYLNYNKSFFSELNRPDLFSGIKARYLRTYPSIVRDICFNKYIEEQLSQKCMIIYNIDLDVVEGIDLMIVTKKNNYGICFYTDTNRAYAGRSVKNHRHTLFDNVKYIEMPIKFKGSVHAGDFFLYGEKEYKDLYNILSK